MIEPDNSASKNSVTYLFVGIGLSGILAFIFYVVLSFVSGFIMLAPFELYFPGYTIFLPLLLVPFLICNALLFFFVRKKKEVKNGVLLGFCFVIFHALVIFGGQSAKETNIRSLQEGFLATQNNDAAACTRLRGMNDELTEVQRADCLNSVAVATNDLSLCESIQIGSTEWSKVATVASRDNCFDAIAVDRNDNSLCNLIVSPSARENCMSTIAIRIQKGIGQPVPDLDTTESSSSSSGYSASYYSSVSSSNSSLSSVMAVASTSFSIAPFDGCNGIAAYANQPWFPVLQQQVQDFTLTTREVSEACLSADYLIFIRTTADASSHLYRFSLREQKLEEAIPEGTGTDKLDTVEYGKRSESQIPLLHGTCVTDFYDINKNTYKASEYLCRNGVAACSAPPTELAIGRSVYPSLQEYAHLTFLGPLFTAARCGPDRLKQAFGGEQANYVLGSTVILYLEPTGHIREVLTSIGYECAPEGCREWRLSKTVKVADLLQLLPYAAVMTSDDCVNCG